MGGDAWLGESSQDNRICERALEFLKGIPRQNAWKKNPRKQRCRSVNSKREKNRRNFHLPQANDAKVHSCKDLILFDSVRNSNEHVKVLVSEIAIAFWVDVFKDNLEHAGGLREIDRG